ncbi:ATP synthase subunit I [Pelobacter propionicus]|uniref:ATP synthase I chain n=1 Tax=Pelobacter propionicus (strain DSM 2379 / NBRC 103807 / OttBd1) TaxID=338966 RepID=A1ASF1_PELPD|nr:ATP synthase subunit I [Pelobacter propionicus]ABL00272.1 conserved hypothetical protein [Pelobacter propionicus DSM 2379]
MITAAGEDISCGTPVRWSMALLLALSLSGVVLFSPSTGLSVLAGGILGIVHFLWLRSTLRAMLDVLPANPGRYAALRFVARMAVLGAILYLLLVSGSFSPLGLLAGLVITLITMVAFSFRAALRPGA